MPNVVFPKYLILCIALAAFYRAEACTLPRDIGANTSDIIGNSTRLSYAQVEKVINIVDDRGEGIEVAEMKAIKNYKGSSLDNFYLISNVSSKESEQYSYKTNWYSCGLVFDYKLGKKYFVAPGFDFYRSAISKVDNVAESDSIFEKSSATKKRINMYDENQLDPKIANKRIKDLIVKCESKKPCSNSDRIELFDNQTFRSLMNCPQSCIAVDSFLDFVRLPQIKNLIEVKPEDRLVIQIVLVAVVQKKRLGKFEKKYKEISGILNAWLRHNKLSISEDDKKIEDPFF